MSKKQKEECMVCGNAKRDEVELVPLFSDDQGNDVTVMKWMCKEDKGCCNEFSLKN